MNALVAYYSRSGTTGKVAEKLASLLKCVSEEIRDTANRKGVLGWLSSGKDATSKKRACAIGELQSKNFSQSMFSVCTSKLLIISCHCAC